MPGAVADSPTGDTAVSAGAAPVDNGGARREAATRAAWAPLGRQTWVAAAFTLAVTLAVTIPRLPPGICFGDPGDLQLASDTLGIMHPPGYTGYVTLGYLLTRIPGVDPAYVVTLACLAAGTIAILLALLWQVRLGVNPWIASAVCLALVGHPQIWSNLLAPEVYAPSIAFLAGSGYMLMRYTRLGRRRDLFIACALYGIVLANRVPVSLAFPFFVLAWWLGGRRWEATWRRSAGNLSIAAAIILSPTAYAFGFIWLRDRTDVPYNYIRQDNAFGKQLPEASEGPEARLQRVWWQMAGLQFREYMGDNWHGVRSKLRWLRHQLLPGELLEVFCALIVILLVADIVIFTRCPPSGVLLLGFGLANSAFVSIYKVHGQAADIVPTVFAGHVLLGVAVSWLTKGTRWLLFRMGGQPLPLPAGFGITLTILLAAWTFMDAEKRYHVRRDYDALPFLSALDIDTLPPNTAVFSIWPYSPPLWYAQWRLTRRPDVEIVNAVTSLWLEAMWNRKDRFLLAVKNPAELDPALLKPYRNVWRVDLSAGPGPLESAPP